MNTSEPVRRRSSAEMTAVIPRDRLPPISIADLTAAVPDLDPDHPETHALLRRAQEGNADRETLIRCEECRDCPCCAGDGMITPGRAVAYAAAKERLAAAEVAE